MIRHELCLSDVVSPESISIYSEFEIGPCPQKVAQKMRHAAEPDILKRVDDIRTKVARVKESISRVIFGQDTVIELVLVNILSGGHALLIGVPGLAKTSLVDALGAALGLHAKRIQFTPDLMPSDIVGTEVLEEKAGSRSFRFIEGPVFAQLLMADEIDRATLKRSRPSCRPCRSDR